MSGLNGTFRSYFGAIAVPVLDPGNGTISNVTHDWSNAMAGLGGGLGVTVLRLEIKNYRVDIAKERLVEQAIKNNCQWILFVDDDTIPPGDALMKMIKLWRSDPKYKVISGVYWSKSDPSVPLVFRGNLEGSYWDWKNTDLIEADAAGAGCLFVDINVFKSMPKPWFSCNYYFEDPRGQLDLQKWGLTDRLGEELLKGDNANPEIVAEIEKQLKQTAKEISEVQGGAINPELFKNKRRDGATTEDLFFFSKMKEAGHKLWIDCSIQCWHQDKRTGKVWGLQPDMPQALPRYVGKMERDKQVVVDIGCGSANYFLPEGDPIRIDLDERVNPDIIADARQIPLEDEFADVVYSSHLLEHFSFRETVSVLREWERILKVGGKLKIIVPNLKWASRNILNNVEDGDVAERSMFMYYSAQKGDLREAYTDFHKAGFTPESLGGLLSRVEGLGDIEIHTTEGNFGNWKEHENHEGFGYNILAIATKKHHVWPVSLQIPIMKQEQMQANQLPVVPEESPIIEAKVEEKNAKRKKAVKKASKTTK
ncbi:MAG: hypothetical protein KCHDKBKB_00776 [Elusimicrobia bacterium]|nr:hypothetical protein [Elusimicrobiota bacterium]